MPDRMLTESIHFQLQGLDGFQHLTSEVLWYLAEHSVVKHFKKSESIWQRADRADFCVVIVEGMVEINSVISNGEERIIGLFGPGEIIGISAMLKGKTFPANAVVSSKTARVFKHYIRGIEREEKLSGPQRTEIQNWLREMLLIHEQILRDKIMITGAGDIHHKLTELFEHLRLRFSSKQDENNFSIEVPMTKTQMAKMIEARVETVIRTLNKWERAGFLKMHEKGLTIKGLDRIKAMVKIE